LCYNINRELKKVTIGVHHEEAGCGDPASSFLCNDFWCHQRAFGECFSIISLPLTYVYLKKCCTNTKIIFSISTIHINFSCL